MGKKRINRIGQIGIEYLTIYGWALAAAAAVFGALFFLSDTPEETTSCNNFQNLLIKGAFADTEKLVLVVQNSTNGRIDGLEAYSETLYNSTNSPPLFQIEIGDATVDGVENALGNSDLLIAEGGIVAGYKRPLEKSLEKRVIIPWNVTGFTGPEFGADGCQFFTESLGKKFEAEITVYYRDRIGLKREETARCRGTIQPATETLLPPESWGC